MRAIASGFIKGRKEAAQKRLNSHFKYTQHRSRSAQKDRESRSIFSAKEDSISRQEATKDIMSHTSRAACFHKLILSPATDEPVNDWKEWTRAVMTDLEKQQGHSLTWYAIHHANTEHEHVHVVLAGGAPHPETGKLEPVKIYAQDLRYLEERGREHSEHEWSHQIDEFVREQREQEREEREQEERQQREQQYDRDDWDR